MIKNFQSLKGNSPSYPDHGGNPKEITESMGIDPELILDFSASINPLGPPSCVSQLLLETPHLLNEYPDPESKRLKKTIAESENIPEDWIRITNGSTELIYLLPFLFSPNQELLIIDPFFSEYEKSFSRFNITIHSHILSPENNFSIQFPELLHQLESIENLGGVVMGYPNSPTGNLQTSEIKDLTEYCLSRQISLFIDETFIDFLDPKLSMWKTYRESPNLVIIRSLTKFYSLPGLRIGYGILSPEKNETIDLHQNPWSVNALAQFIGSEVIRDNEFRARTRSWLQEEKQFMLEELATIKEIETFYSETNFILFRIRNNKTELAHRLFKFLLANNILLRNCGNFIGLDECFFRTSIRNRKDNQKLINSLKEFFSNLRP
ncbi:MAG: aminotransferase class I/II-fold pyridoxal phosphate-dependent enzyme [Nitrospinota bacterium]